MDKANEILWQIFQNSGCTQTEFCIRLGYGKSYSNMSGWLNGKTRLSLDKLVEFCEKLNVKLKIELE
jgi:transcriptional regulator with XRE-family HTH domain